MIIRIAALAAAVVTATPAAAAAIPWLATVADSYPSVSPDGKTILFQTNRPGRQALFIANADGKNVRSFLDNGHDPGTPMWSPDGKLIVYCETVDDQEEVFVIRSDGTGRKRLTFAPGHDSHPHWGADNRIYFSSPRATPDIKADWSHQWHSIYSMKPDGSDVRLKVPCHTICTFPVLSPDGKKIAFRKVTDGPSFGWGLEPVTRNSDVFVSDLDGNHQVDVSKSAAYDGWPMWSPDGQWLAFTSNRVGPANVGQIFLVHPDGTGLKQVSFGPWSHAQPAYTPDGSVLFVYTLDENQGQEFGFISRVDLARGVP